MKLTKNETIFLGIIWAFALGTIAFAYANTTKKQNESIEPEHCSGYTTKSGEIVLTECEIRDVDFVQDEPFLGME